MLEKTMRVLTATGNRLEDLLSRFARNYAQELLAAQGLAGIEVDHVWEERQRRQEAEAVNYKI